MGRPAPREFGVDEPGWSITGWPYESECDCGARAVMLSAMFADASYECRGQPTTVDGFPSDYGPDRCGKVFTRTREEESARG